MLFDESQCYLLREIQKRYENEIKVIETCERVARLSIFIAHQTGLINTFVAKGYLMVSEAIFIVKCMYGNCCLERRY